MVHPAEKCVSLVPPMNALMLQRLIIQFYLYYLLNCLLRKVKNKRKFQSFSSKMGRGRLGEVVASKRFQIQWFGSFGILEKWSQLKRGVR